MNCLLLFTFATDALGELHILGHDGDTLGMDGAAVGVLVETDEVGLGGFLKGENRLGLEAEILLELLGDLVQDFEKTHFGVTQNYRFERVQTPICFVLIKLF